MSAVTSFGAFAHGINTAPMTRSDSFTAYAMLYGLDMNVFTWLTKMSAS